MLRLDRKILLGTKQNMSLSPSKRLGLIIARNDAALARDPDQRREINVAMLKKLQAQQFGIEERGITEERTGRDLNKEQAFREAARREELEAVVYGRYGEILDNAALTQAWGAGPVLAYLATSSPLHGRLMSKSDALRRYAGAAGYDGAEGLPRFLFGGGLSVDEAAQALFEEGLISDGHVDTMWQAIHDELNTATRYREFKETAKEELKRAKNTAHEEAAEWRREADEIQKVDHSPKAQQLRDLRTLDLMISALLPEIRAKVGGFVKLAEFSTDEARFKEIGRRREKISKLLERFLADENRDSIEPSLEQAPMPDGSPLPDTPVLRNPASVLSSSSLLAFGMAAWCIVLAAVDFHARWPYEVSKWGICAGSIVLARHFEKGSWRFLLVCILAVIFNPIAPIHFANAWHTVDGIAAVGFVAVSPVLGDKWPKAVGLFIYSIIAWWFVGPRIWKADKWVKIGRDVQAAGGGCPSVDRHIRRIEDESFRERCWGFGFLIVRWILTAYALKPLLK